MPGFVKVTKLSGLKENVPSGFEINKVKFLLVKLNGKVYAMNSVCTHAGGPLEKGTCENGNILCPWHKSEFKVTDGSVARGPAIKPEQTYKVNVVGDDVLVEL